LISSKQDGQERITVFDDIHSLSPEQAARWTSLAEQSLALLAEGTEMQAVQRFLLGQGAGLIESIAITRVLIGTGPGSLAKAKEIVLTSDARTAELKEHERLLDSIEEPWSQARRAVRGGALSRRRPIVSPVKYCCDVAYYCPERNAVASRSRPSSMSPTGRTRRTSYPRVC